MEPIVSPWIFYLISTASKLHDVMVVVAFLFGLAALFMFVFATDTFKEDLSMMGMSREEQRQKQEKLRANQKHLYKRSLQCLIAGSACLLASILIPDRQTMVQMLVASYVTPDNVQFIQDNIVQFVSDTAKAIANAK